MSKYHDGLAEEDLLDDYESGRYALRFAKFTEQLHEPQCEEFLWLMRCFGRVVEYEMWCEYNNIIDTARSQAYQKFLNESERTDYG